MVNHEMVDVKLHQDMSTRRIASSVYGGPRMRPIACVRVVRYRY